MEHGFIQNVPCCPFSPRNRSNFWPPDMWPPNSPDLNPLDFGFWPRMTRLVNGKSYDDVGALKIAINRSSKSLKKQFVQKVTTRFRAHVEAVLEGEGAFVG